MLRRICDQELGYCDCLGLCRLWTVKKFTAADFTLLPPIKRPLSS